MTLVTGKNKEFSTILSKSGNGKTVLEYLLLKSKQLPALIVDNYNQFNGVHKSLKELNSYFLDFENVKDFKECNRHVLVSLKHDEAAEFYKYLLASPFLGGSLIVNDEIDMTLGTANVHNSHPFYEFCNRGRHLEYSLITTARATQNIPKVLTQQTDVFYIGKVQNAPMMDYIESNTNLDNIKDICKSLNDFEYLKYNTKTERLEKFKLSFELLKLFK